MRCKCRSVKEKILTVSESPPVKKETKCETFSWETAFSLTPEHKLKRGSLLTTLPTLAKEWKISFQFRPSSYEYNGYAEIGHMMIGYWSGSIGIHKKKGVYFAISLNGSSILKNFVTDQKPPLNEWTVVEMSQARDGSKYIFSLFIEDKMVDTYWTIENKYRREFSDVKVFASSNEVVAQAGSIRGLWIENRMPSKDNNFYPSCARYLAETPAPPPHPLPPPHPHSTSE